MDYEMKLDDGPFEVMEKGLKTIEIRLCDKRREAITAGDRITFNNPSKGKLVTTVVGVEKYNNIDELIDGEDFLKTGGLYSNPTDWREHILSYYPMSEQEKFGMLSIELSISKDLQG
jgi:ASC-1-like (ASCH) protein